MKSNLSLYLLYYAKASKELAGPISASLRLGNTAPFKKGRNQRRSRGHKARGQGQGHKKVRGQGQGQPFRGQTLSRPRTGMLEAKAKDQGHKRKCSSKKKKVFTKIF